MHRDLKPANVMLLKSEAGAGRPRVKVLDFGIAKMSAETEGSLRTETGAMIGTPAYMAPEQCLSAPNVDGKADVYALGVILYEMLSGRLPFLDESSWINQVERFFALLTQRQIRWGTHRSVQELEAALRHYIDEHNNHSTKPFIWTKTADQILESIERFLSTNFRDGTVALSDWWDLAPGPSRQSRSAPPSATREPPQRESLH